MVLSLDISSVYVLIDYLRVNLYGLGLMFLVLKCF